MEKKIKIFDKKFWITFGIFLVLILIILFLPYLITQKSWVEFDFVSTGSIGDTLGGIISPFVAIVAAGLTFLAFYVQYKANEIQIENFNEQKKQFEKQNKEAENKNYAERKRFEEQLEAQKKQIDEQKKAWEVEQFENKFFEMVRLHKENVNEIQEINKDGIVKQGRQLFVTMYREFEFCYKVVSQLCEKEPELKEDANLIRVAYAFYYTGVGQGAEPVFKEIIGDKPLINQIKKYLTTLQNNYKKETESSKLKMPNNKFETFYTDYRPMHGYIVGHYYRHLYQTIKFVETQTFLDDKDKRKYARIIRAQLTDYEQVMLYYNVISGFGRKWVDEKKINSKYGLLIKHKMIHNAIPKLLSIGKEENCNERDTFKEQLRLWKQHNPKEKFFEWYEGLDDSFSEETELF